MNKQWNEITLPTAEQVEQTKRVERALIHEMNLLGREGVPTACILTGLGMVIADLITTQAEPAAVAPWFEKQAAMLRSFENNNGRTN